MPPLNLDLHFHHSPNGYRVRLDSPMGQISADFELPVSAQEKAQGQGLGPQEIGGRIFRALFKGGAESLLQRNLDRAGSQKTTLRIRLRLNDTPELAALPWEALHDPARQRFLALATESTVLRYLELPDPPPPLQAPRPLRILGVLASPQDLKPLNVEGEWHALQTALAPAIDRGDMTLERLTPPTLDALRACLRQDPPIHVLHVVGHGGFDATGDTGLLMLGDGAGVSAAATAADLAVQVGNAPDLRLILLNTCEGALSGAGSPFTGMAGALVQRNIPSVIAMQREISDRGGIRFAQELYSALADGLSVDAAITQGRMALHSLGDHEWPIPVFFTRAPDDRLFGLDPNLTDRHFTVPFPRNHGFVGREEDLAHLHTALQGTETVGIRPAGLTGQGGIGKTQLAVEYCYRHFHDQDDYPGGVFWVNAAEEWRQGFAALGRRVEPDCAERPTEQQIQAAARYLHGHADALLVLDNVADPARLLRPVIPELIPADLPGPVLFTTRRRDLGRFQPVEVSVLPPGPALALLLSHPSRADVRQPHHPEHATAQEICRILGGLPLALEIAAAHLGKRPTQPVAAYRDALLNRGALAVVDDSRGGVRDEDLGTRHAAAVAATLAEQWDLVQSEDARLLLRIAGQLPEAAQIPTARLGLLAAISDDEDGFFDSPLAAALAELADASLIDALADGAIRLHPLVREFAAELTPLEQRSEEREQWAANIFASYSRIQTLQNHCTRRSIAAVEQDVVATLDLFDPEQGYFLLNLTKITQYTVQNLRFLLSLLTRYSHELRQWERFNQPAYFAQQIQVHTVQTSLIDLANSAAEYLTVVAADSLQLNWAATRYDVALTRTLKGHGDLVRSVAITSDGRWAVSASSDRTVRVWNLERGENVLVLIGHEGWVRSVAVTPNGRWALSASSDRTIRVWDLKKGKSVAILTGHEDQVNAVAVTADGCWAISASSDRTVRVWNVRQEECVAKLTGHERRVNAVAITSDGQRAVSASADQTIRVWELDRRECSAVLTGHESWVKAVAITSDGRQAVSASADRTVRVWNLETGESVATLEGHEDWVRSVALTPDGRRAVSASSDRTVRVWDLETGENVATLIGHEDWVRSVAMTPDGRRAVSASQDETVRVWDILPDYGVHNPQSNNMEKVTGHKSEVTCVAIAPDGRWAISASSDRTMRVWNMDSGESMMALTGHEDWVNAVAVMPNGRQVVSASSDRTVRVWNLERKVIVMTFTDHDGWVNSVAVTADGRRVVSASSDRTVRVWDVLSDIRFGRRASAATLTGHESWVRSVAVTPDGRRVVSGSSDRTIRVWDLVHRQLIATLVGHSSRVKSVTMTPDGRRVVSASSDRTVRVWNMPLGRNLDQTNDQNEVILKGHRNSVNSVAVTSDGRRAVSASSDQTVRVWDLDTFRQLAVVTLDSALRTVTIAPDDITIMTGDVLGNVYCLKYTEGRKEDG